MYCRVREIELKCIKNGVICKDIGLNLFGLFVCSDSCYDVFFYDMFC